VLFLLSTREDGQRTFLNDLFILGIFFSGANVLNCGAGEGWRRSAGPTV
jgi:hypothetical protein